MKTYDHLKVATWFADLLDNRFTVAGIRFGLDPLLDFIPGIGDVIGAVLSLYIVWIGFQMHVPLDKLVEMLLNVLVDFLIGLVPVLGEVGDALFKSNMMNLAILQQYAHIIEGETA